jgi:RNA polymerase sigma-70 factor (ECF subfamily)
VWTGSPDVADDIAQRVLISVHRSIGEFSPQAAVTTWVYRITRNALIDHDRETAKHERLRDELHLEQLVRELGEHDRKNGDMRNVLLRLMHELSPRQRAVLDLVDLQGFEATVAADMLDLSPATVRVHLHRAREALRFLCREHGLLPETTEGIE